MSHSLRKLPTVVTSSVSVEGRLPNNLGPSYSGKMKLRLENHDELKYLVSTYSADNDRIYTGVGRKGARIITFDPILKANIFPLGEILQYFLDLGARAMNVPVEVEFAAEMNPEPDVPNEFRLLQIRPMKVANSFEDVTVYDEDDGRVVARSDQSPSNGRITDGWTECVGYDLGKRQICYT